MDKNLEFVVQKKIERVINALYKNNMDGYFVKSREELIEKIKELTNEGETVTCGGSMTLFETGVIDYLRCGRYNFLDRYVDGLTPEQLTEIYRKAFFANSYFVSTNALTEDGELYNVDGTGNRVAAMLYGPDKVIVVCGVNKIVNNVEEAIERNRRVAAPVNAVRINRKTPCAKVGYCMDCNSPERICNEYVLIRKQKSKGRIHVIILNEELGY
ncbi:membrane protein [Clostridium polyendosporum]|uniref:Membrane protein n=1 Tax=Clostridium polyendosporum TaxID=69208 RepID=A0A919S1K7_9CLOT|nr:lactate utilization protein [Clostridium polyendosporum]GIM28928.1 membrane protein [Clostridium polyendosporum]